MWLLRGACVTTTIVPSKQTTQPHLARDVRSSLSTTEARSALKVYTFQYNPSKCFEAEKYLTRTDNPPSGVTTVAGAKAYAQKFVNSPKLTKTGKTLSLSYEALEIFNMIRTY